MADIIEYITYAWKKVNSIKIRNCFKKCRKSKENYVIGAGGSENNFRSRSGKYWHRNRYWYNRRNNDEWTFGNDDLEENTLCEIGEYEDKCGIYTCENEEVV